MAEPVKKGFTKRNGERQEFHPCGICAHCKTVQPLKDAVVAYHSWPKPTRQVCAGARKPPLSDHCHAGRDGECNWQHCPQEREGEPTQTGRHCPLDWRDYDE